MTHLWVRAEQRDNEERVGLTPAGAKALIDAGVRVTVEESSVRAIPLQGYVDAGAEIVPENSWSGRTAQDAIIFGLKELPEDDTPAATSSHHVRPCLQRASFRAKPLLRTLQGRAVAGSTIWNTWSMNPADVSPPSAIGQGLPALPSPAWPGRRSSMGKSAARSGLTWTKTRCSTDLTKRLDATGEPRPTAIVIGALGRVGTGASDLCQAMGIAVTKWDLEETAHGGPFPEILATHDLFLNCISRPSRHTRISCPEFRTDCRPQTHRPSATSRAIRTAITTRCQSMTEQPTGLNRSFAPMAHPVTRAPMTNHLSMSWQSTTCLRCCHGSRPKISRRNSCQHS